MTIGDVQLPRLSVVLETSTWHRDGAIQLDETLRSLRDQDYPEDKLQIVPVLYGSTAPYESVLDAYGIDECVVVPEGTGYYEGKRAGLQRAAGEIVAFIDADNWMPANWAREMVAPLMTRADVWAVLGRTRYREGLLSRFWDMLWWDRSFAPAGPTDTVGGNNAAFRREGLESRWYPDLGRLRGAWERAMTDAVHGAGGVVWFAPAAHLTHDYSAGLRTHLQRAYARGFSLLARRYAYPRRGEGQLASFRWLVPWLAFPPLVAKDVRRLVTRFFGSGYGRGSVWKFPGLLLVLLLSEPVTLAGMLRTLNRHGHVEPP